MKSLLLKDMYYMKKQRGIFLLFLLGALAFILVKEESYFAFTYMLAVTSSISLSTISYDEMGGGYLAIFCLPISRRDYVQSKYLGPGILCFLVLLILVITSLVAETLIHHNFVFQDWIAQVSLGFGLFVLMTSLSVPILFKYGVENSRTAVFITYGALLAIGFGIYKLIESFFLEEFMGFLTLLEGNFALSILVLWVFFIVIILISYRISLRIFEGKEF